MRQTSIAMLEKQINARITKLGQRKPFIVGSLVESKRKCGNKNCRCANGGELHSAHILTKRENGKTKTVYIPVNMVEEVGEWSREYKKLKELIREIDQLSEKVIATTKKRKKAVVQAARAAREII
jgi:nucleoside-triphosphatase THEP1